MHFSSTERCVIEGSAKKAQATEAILLKYLNYSFAPHQWLISLDNTFLITIQEKF